MKKIVIIGGCAAGPKTAAKAKRVNPEHQIELYTMENIISYSACGMPYYIEGSVPSAENLIIRKPEDFQKQGIDIFLNHKCTKILPNEKTVIFNTEDEVKKVSYDELVLCIGSKPYTPKIKNVNLKNIFHLKVLEDGIKIKEKMEQSKSVIMLGGGYIAIELLEGFVKNGLNVTIVERGKEIMSQFDPEISAIIKEHIIQKDGKQVHFIMEDEIVEFLGKNEFEGAVTKNPGHYPGGHLHRLLHSHRGCRGGRAVHHDPGFLRVQGAESEELFQDLPGLHQDQRHHRADDPGRDPLPVRDLPGADAPGHCRLLHQPCKLQAHTAADDQHCAADPGYLY